MGRWVDFLKAGEHTLRCVSSAVEKTRHQGSHHQNIPAPSAQEMGRLPAAQAVSREGTTAYGPCQTHSVGFFRDVAVIHSSIYY